ncbi:MAG: Sec-independent protein translocase protein TatB [Pseudomonadota bacterium]
MPDIGWLELLIVGVVALIVVGPKDLPKMFRAFGQFTGRVRGMAREFSRAMNDAADESGMNDIARDFKSISNPKNLGLDSVKKTIADIDPKKYPEGSETRKLAEKRAADAKAAKARAEERRAEREAASAQAASQPDTPEPAEPSETSQP